MKKTIALILVFLSFSLFLVSCSIRNPGTVEAVAESQIPPEDLRSASAAFPVGSSDIFAFRYEWENPTPEAAVWLEIYQNGERSEPLRTYLDEMNGKSGMIYLFAHDTQSPHWAIGLTNDAGTSGGSAFSYNDPGEFSGSFSELSVSQLSAGTNELSAAKETVLAVLLYDNNGAVILSPEELAEDTGKLQNAGLAVVLKCLFSQGRISS